MKPEEYPSETFYKYTIVTGVLENFERMSFTYTNTGNCHSLNVPVITYLPLVKATESVLPTLLLIRDTIACHGIWVNLHLSSSLASTVSPSIRPGQHQNMQNIGQRRSRFSFWRWQPIHASWRTYSCPLFVTHEHRPVELMTRLIDTCSWAIAEHWAGLVDSSIKIEALHFWPPSQCC